MVGPIESTFTAYFAADGSMVSVPFGDAPPPGFADVWVAALDSMEGGCTWRVAPAWSDIELAAVLDIVELWDPDLFPVVVPAAVAERDLLALQGVPRD